MIWVTISFDSQAQRMPANQDLQKINVPMKTLRVIPSKFNSDETSRATTDFKMFMSNNNNTKRAILSLRQKKYSLPSIMATLRKSISGSTNAPTTTSTVSNTNIADDVQLMLKSISDLTASDLLGTIQTLYNASDVDLFDISLLAMQDDFETIYSARSFTFQCECRLHSDQTPSSSKPLYATKTMTYYASSYKHAPYAWECYSYWNTGMRNLLLQARGLNAYLNAMRKSQFPLYKGMLKDDLNDASINFKTILGNTGDSLSRLMECVALGNQPLATSECPSNRPVLTSTSYSGESAYRGWAYFPYTVKPMCRLADVLPVIKRNGYTITEIAKAAKKRFSPDGDKKQKIIESFDKTIFTTADLLEVARVLNEN